MFVRPTRQRRLAALGVLLSALLQASEGDALQPVAETGFSSFDEVADGFAYSTLTTGMRILDLSDPTAPVERGTFPTPGSALVVAADGTIVCLVSRDSMQAMTGFILWVVDVSDPDAPTTLGMTTLPELATDLELTGGFAYLSTVTGWRIVDVRNPAAPEERASSTALGASKIAVADGFAYVAHANATAAGSGLRILDVADPTTPIDLGRLETPTFAHDVQVRDGLAFVLEGELGRGLRVLDVSDPRAPEMLGALSAPLDFDAHALTLGDEVVFAATSFALISVDVSDPSAPEQIGELGLRCDPLPFSDGTFLYCGRRVLDTSLPDRPTARSVASVAGSARGLSVAGTRVFVAAGVEGLAAFEVVGADEAELLGDFSGPPGDVADVEVRASTAFAVGSDPSGLALLDVSDPGDPAMLDFVALSGAPASVDVNGDLAHVALDPGGLVVVDVSEPNSAVVLGSLAGFAASDIEATDSRSYLAGDAFRIVDVSDPMEPAELSSDASPCPCNDVELAGDRAYLAAERGFSIWDITSDTPVLETELRFHHPTFEFYTMGARAVDVAEDRALVATYFSMTPTGGMRPRLYLFDVSSPSAVETLANVPFALDVELLSEARLDGSVAVGTDRDLRVVDFGPEYLPEPLAGLGYLAALVSLGALRRARRSAKPSGGSGLPEEA